MPRVLLQRFLLWLAACLRRDIVDMILKKLCHEHEGIEAMTKPFLHKREERIINIY